MHETESLCGSLEGLCSGSTTKWHYVVNSEITGVLDKALYEQTACSLMQQSGNSLSLTDPE